MKKFNLIRKWAKKRGLYSEGDVKTQFVKLSEEQGELAQAILKKDIQEFQDAIGDMIIVLTNLAHLGNKYFDTYPSDSIANDGGDKVLTSHTAFELEDCIDKAYNVIKSREGHMDNGTFVKSIK